ncbi:MAG: radical SAM protein [Thermoleophilia bacterium]|nr:radical SAM protein [Thermoleophilia bacterium]
MKRDRVPINGAFDLTYRCNFQCVHCYVGHLTARHPAQAGELTTGQVVDILSRAADAGCLFLLLSGGEPLLREDFVEIYVAARRLGLIVTVFTNGSLVSDEHLNAFREYPPHSVEISVHGSSEDTYARITGAAGRFRRVRLGIESLLDQGVRLNLKTMVLRDNESDIPEIEEYAKSLGVGFRLDPLLTPRLDGNPAPLSHRVDPDRAADLELRSAERRLELLKFYDRYRSAVDEKPKPVGRLFRCGAGIASFHIDPQGFMRPCLLGGPYAYDVKTLGFKDAWQAVTTAVDHATWEDEGRCGGCPDVLLCGYCPGLFMLEQATPAAPPEYLCRLGTARRRWVDQEQTEVVCVRGG